MSTVTLDIVVPVFNEEQVLGKLLERLWRVFSPDACRQHRIGAWRVIFVDDGSRDRSVEIVMDRLKGPDGEHLALCRLSRNFGHQSAISAGLSRATADVVAVMDADLQDPPEVVLGMLEQWRAGFDVVYGVRRNRREGPVKRFCYWAFYRLVHYLSEGHIPVDSGDFALMDRRVVETMNALPEHLRFVRGLRAWIGFPQIGLPYDRPARHAGRPKYSWQALYKLATDGIASSSIRPLRIIQLLALLLLLLSVVASLQVLGLSVASPASASRFPPATVSLLVISVVGFFQVFCLYVLSGYIGRMYLEVKGRPAFIIMEHIDGGRPQGPL